MFIKQMFIIFLLSVVKSDDKFKLKQVLMLSRHNVRTPLSKTLSDYTPKTWPIWNEKRGYLTAKGALLESFMGIYVTTWLKKENLLDQMCPSDEQFYVYANTAQRTIASAQAFINSAFPHCNITLHHTSKDSDPIFNPFIHNTSITFKMEAIEQMEILLKSLHLNESYKYLEQILQYKGSEKCLKEHKCDLNNDKNRIFIMPGTKPNLDGPLKISKSVIDSFIMENYEGFPLQDVAWGNLLTRDNWNAVLDVSISYHNIIFNTSLIAKDISKPLLDFMTDIFTNEKHQVTLLMGHDANIYTILKSMGFKPYNLVDQYEKIPAGGKIVFQKWKEIMTGIYYVKIDYFYQSTDGMRAGKILSLDNPPQITNLEIEGCKINLRGMCLWSDFMKLLNNL